MNDVDRDLLVQRDMPIRVGNKNQRCSSSRSAVRSIAVLMAIMSVLAKTSTRSGGRGFGIFANAFSAGTHPARHRSAVSRSTRRFASPVATAEPASAGSRLFPEEINVLYDSKCNVCKLEMDWLVSRDVRLNGSGGRKLKLTDLEDDYDATDPSNGGIDYATGMAAIYAVKHDGTVYKGVPVFELAYDQVGLGWIWRVNRIPAVQRFLEWGYEIFARNRTRLTRGTPLEELLALHAAKQKELDDNGECESCSAKYENSNNQLSS